MSIYSLVNNEGFSNSDVGPGAFFQQGVSAVLGGSRAGGPTGTALLGHYNSCLTSG